VLTPASSGSASASGSAGAPAASSADPLLGVTFFDDFERPELGPNYYARSPVWRIDAGRLCARGARNQGVWLKRRIPTNARIEFAATSSSTDGDLKAELWGDGRAGATAVSYTNATSYLTIFGGWKNTFHVLARIDEHAPDRPQVRLDPDSDEVRSSPVKPDRIYRFKVERSDGKTVRWWVDDVEILSLADPAPLAGPGHEHVGFNDWDAPVCFDDLRITPLEGTTP
jgi:hypothetical protein